MAESPFIGDLKSKIKNSSPLGNVGRPDSEYNSKYDDISAAWANSFTMDTPIEYKPGAGKPIPKNAYLRGGSSGTNAQDFANDITSRQAANREQPVRAGDLFNEIAGWSQSDPDGYQRLQQDLYMAGFYGQTKYENIAIGQLDDDSVGAFGDLLSRTSRINSSMRQQGQPTLSWREVLQQGITSFGEIMTKVNSKGGGGGGGGGRAPRSVTLSDPTGLSSALDQLAQQVLGRKAKAEEQRMFITLMHGMERSYQLSDVGGVRPDMQGQGEQLLRKEAAVEAKAHDFRNVFDVFAKMVGSG